MTVLDFEKHIRALLGHYSYKDQPIQLPNASLQRTGTDHYKRPYELRLAQFIKPGLRIRYDHIITHAIGKEHSGFLSISAPYKHKTFSVGVQEEYTITITDLFRDDEVLQTLHGKSLWDLEEEFYSALENHIKRHARMLGFH